MDCSTPGFPVQHQLPELTQTHVHWVGDAIQPSHPLLSPSPPAFNLSQHQGLFLMSQFFASTGQSIWVSASASVLPMNIQDWSPSEWTGWISLQSRRLSSLLQHHSSKASILQCSAFFIVQFSYPYMTAGKTIALTRGTFVGKVMSLLFNMLSQFSSVQSLSRVWLFGTPWIAARKGLPVYHQLPEFTQTRVRVSDAIQPSHPLSSPSSPAPNSSQHQSLFQWVNSSHEVAEVLEFQL